MHINEVKGAKNYWKYTMDLFVGIGPLKTLNFVNGVVNTNGP